jgi:Ca2+-binding EF-hand superfamily protein
MLGLWEEVRGKDPKKLARWMRRMGKEMGEEVSDEEIEQAVEDVTTGTDAGPMEED